MKIIWIYILYLTSFLRSATQESNTEVCTTTCPQVETDNIPEKVSEIQEEKSLSAILLDHPSDREGMTLLSSQDNVNELPI